MSVKVMTYDEYCIAHGVSPRPPSEAGMHARGHMNDTAHRRALRGLEGELRNWQEDRDRMTDAYNRECDEGTIRPPTHWERLEKIAKGDPDRKDVQAARRLLEKRKERLG